MRSLLAALVLGGTWLASLWGYSLVVARSWPVGSALPEELRLNYLLGLVGLSAGAGLPIARRNIKGENMLRILVPLAFLVTTSSCLAAQPPTEEGIEQVVSQIVEHFAEQDLESVGQLLHYPPTYSDDELTADVAEVVKGLRLLIRHFGTPSDVQRYGDPVSLFQVAIGGGDVPYWQSLSPFQVEDFVFSAHFSELGPGFILVRILRHPILPGPVIRKVGLGLSLEREDARTHVAAVFKDMLRSQGRALPPNIDQLLENSLKPVEYIGVREESPAAR